MKQYNLADSRWDGYVPLLFRGVSTFIQYTSAVQFLDLICPALERHFKYNEPKIINLNHFEELIVSETFNSYKIPKSRGHCDPCYSFPKYFSSDTVTSLVLDETNEITRNKILCKDIDFGKHKPSTTKFIKYFYERLHTLEIILRNLPDKEPNVIKFKTDVNKFFLVSNIQLEYNLSINQIKHLEEPLLQNHFDLFLLPRISNISHSIANDFIKMYQLLSTTTSKDEVFINAFKNLEEFTRLLTKDSKFEFKRPYLWKYFPELHPTIVTTIEKLEAQRGAEGGHGKNEPDEIRYLLFAIMNIALLLLDYKEFHKK